MRLENGYYSAEKREESPNKALIIDRQQIFLFRKQKAENTFNYSLAILSEEANDHFI